MEETINQRIKILMDEYANGVVRQFARMVGENYETIGRLFRKDATAQPSTKTINSIIKAFPDISPEWIVNGMRPKKRPISGICIGIGQRINRWMDENHISYGEFAEKTHQHVAYLHELVNNDNLPVARSLLIFILDAYPNLSPRYLAYGEGEMYRTTPGEDHGPPSVHINASPGDTINLTIHLSDNNQKPNPT